MTSEDWEPICPFCGCDPFHYVDNGVGMEAAAVTCCDLGDLYFRGARETPEEVTLSWDEFCELGERILATSSAERGAVEMQPGDLGMILRQCPVALGMEGHDCNGPHCNCGSTILTPDAWVYVDRQDAERGMREALPLAVAALEEAEAILGGEYGDQHAVLCERMADLRAALVKATKA